LLRNFLEGNSLELITFDIRRKITSDFPQLTIHKALTTNKTMKMKKIIFLGILALIISCSSTKSLKPKLVNNNRFLITEISVDNTYGVTEKNPVKVGGIKSSEGPKNERRYLNSLTGPNGEDISYFRAGSCCHFKTKNGMMGMGLLDNYRVTWQGAKDTVSIYINMYDYGVLKAPVGFKIKE